MDELSKLLEDRFEGYELCELLDIPVEEVVAAFSDRIEANRSFLEEYLSHGR